MARNDDRRDASGLFKFGVLLAVVIGIVVVLAMQAVPKAERPTMRTPITVETTP